MMKHGLEMLSSAIEKWIRETVENASVSGVVLGLSGGLDSSVSAALCAGALGPDKVLGILMPCGNHPDDERDAAAVADFLGIRRRTVRLDTPFDSLVAAAGLDPADPLKMGNIKARLRMTVIYAHSEERLVAGTSNRSEYLVGYTTKWADGVADFHPLLNLYKSRVRGLAAALGLPSRIIERVPSAGLWPGQSDEGEMGVTYEEIESYFERGPGSITPGAAERISLLRRATRHKREPIPAFNYERWVSENG